MKARGDRSTPDLLDWKPPAVAVGFDETEIRGGEIGSQISRAIGFALKQTSKDRETVAREVSALLGQKVSRATLDAYAAEAKVDHQITLERFIALIKVTDCLDLLGMIADQFDHAVVPNRFAAIIELHLIGEHKAELDARELVLSSRLRRP